MPDTGSWPRGTQDPIGQAGEFLVWATLIAQSGGGLHVFLPVLDRGLDALVHRLSDRKYLALQAKTKTYIQSSEAPIAVLESHIYTPDQLIVGVHLDGYRLGEYALVADGETYAKKAGRVIDGTRVLLVADMPVRPIPGHKWSDDLVPIGELAQRLGARVPALAAPSPPVPPPADADRIIGSWGELEVLRRLLMLEDCGLFRPFPDNETAEVVVRRLATGATIGLQVKTAQLDQRHSYRHVLVNRSNFVSDPATYVVALAWILPERRFHETCLLIPSELLTSIAGASGPYYELHFRPDGSSETSKLDGFRLPLESLGAEIARRLGS
ncbi:MAG: hypothetical protein ABI334_00410 [Candidatus Dormiibacterota bacterium]